MPRLIISLSTKKSWRRLAKPKNKVLAQAETKAVGRNSSGLPNTSDLDNDMIKASPHSVGMLRVFHILTNIT